MAAEGKTILTPGHKSADELERQLRQPSHRRSMPQYAHACSKDMGGQDVRPKANRRKIIHSPGEKDHDCFHLVFRVVAGIKMKNVAKQNAPRLLSAICHLSKLPTEREMPPLCLINMFEENHESTKQLARNSSVCQSHCRDFGTFLDACIRRALEGGPPLLNRALVLNSKIAFFRQDTINLMSSRNNWVSGRGAAKLVVT